MVQFTTILIVRFILLILFLFHFSGIAANNACALLVAGDHYSVHHLNDFSTSFKMPVTVFSPCKAPVHIYSTDKKFKLGNQNYKDPDHYFNWNNWKTTKRNGDGGVDVTGAPISQLVEGANSVKLNIASGGEVMLSITIPAEGYMTFNWDHIGSSTTSNAILKINGMALSNGSRSMNSLLLKQGTRIDLVFKNSGDQLEVFEVKDFRFITEAIEVICRDWSATDIMGNQGRFCQFIAIEKTPIHSIFFPNDYKDFNVTNFVANHHIADPDHTGGYPFLDEDGNPQTDYDQVPLNGEVSGLETSWTDEVISELRSMKIIRTWKIVDVHSNNTRKAKQIIYLSSDNFTEKGGQQKTALNKTKEAEVETDFVELAISRKKK